MGFFFSSDLKGFLDEYFPPIFFSQRSFMNTFPCGFFTSLDVLGCTSVYVASGCAWRGFTFAFFLTRNRDRNFRKHPGVLFTYSKNEYHILLIGNCQLSVTCVYYLGSVFFIYIYR